ncbi:hypothetical protein HBA55_36550 [Pseudomaricurvus alkylphenolicus]|uniref:hypothetical protein n=1 Tax=Pseudomaricurvus alkylphenolicus TaxID=1306991 RepID=UPI001420DC7C|nr:hypothetical protein [Pseudomaricurvus alkylphenolicus]NIB45147.1 hypothetical protein [Pseudomaricurvus alkylphenolicus]
MKRPIPMTVIALFFGLIACVQLFGFVAGVISGEITTQLILMGVAGIVSVMAVMTTWKQKVASLYWFGIMFLIGLSNYTGIFTEQRPPMGPMDITNWVVLISVIVYLWTLKAKGVLKCDT